jgi:hypothetical protein
MRQTIILLVLACAGGLLAACGGNGQPRAHSTTVVHSGTTPSGSPTRAQALAFAHAVTLTAADVPGFSVSSDHEGESAREQRLERAMLRCAGAPSTGKGASAPQGLAQESSKDFNLKHGILSLGVTSEVSVAQTSALARKELAALRSARVRGCFSHYIDLVLKGQQYGGGASIGHVSIQSGTPPAPGMTGSFGWRVSAALTVDRIRIPFYLDFLGFVDGPAQVTLLSSGVPRPFPADAQQRLFSLLLSRARAHRL